MKVLCIVPQLPLPADNGQKVGVLNVLRAFHALGAELQVLSFLRDGEKPAPIFEGVPLHCVRNNLRNSMLGAGLAALARKPYTLLKYHDPRMGEEVRRLVQQFKPDIVHIETVHMGSYMDIARNAGAKVCGIRAHNVEHLIWQRVAQNSKSPLIRVFASLQQGPVFRREMDFISRADVVFPVSEEDADIFRRQSRVKAMVMPSIVELPRTEPSPVPASSEVLFVGSLDWFPNEDGIRWFAEQVWGRVVQQSPSAQLVIVGRKAPPSIRSLSSGSIKVHSDVANVAEFYARARVVVVPIRIGGGIRMKILEAMAHGRPIVSTSIGAEGLGFKSPDSLLIVDDPAKMAVSIGTLLTDTGTAARIVASAKQDLLARFSLESCTNTLKRGYSV